MIWVKNFHQNYAHYIQTTFINVYTFKNLLAYIFKSMNYPAVITGRYWGCLGKGGFGTEGECWRWNEVDNVKLLPRAPWADAPAKVNTAAELWQHVSYLMQRTILLRFCLNIVIAPDTTYFLSNRYIISTSRRQTKHTCYGFIVQRKTMKVVKACPLP